MQKLIVFTEDEFKKIPLEILNHIVEDSKKYYRIFTRDTDEEIIDENSIKGLFFDAILKGLNFYEVRK